MKTIKKTEFLKRIKDQDFKTFATELLNDGFKLIHAEYKNQTRPEIKYFHFSKNDKIGYTQINWPGFSYNISSCYAPSREHGTGTIYKYEVEKLNIQDALKCFDYYLHNPEQRPPKFYKNLDDFFNTATFKDNYQIVTS